MVLEWMDTSHRISVVQAYDASDQSVFFSSNMALLNDHFLGLSCSGRSGHLLNLGQAHMCRLNRLHFFFYFFTITPTGAHSTKHPLLPPAPDRTHTVLNYFTNEYSQWMRERVSNMIGYRYMMEEPLRPFEFWIDE
jgi:hypothetical protein